MADGFELACTMTHASSSLLVLSAHLDCGREYYLSVYFDSFLPHLDHHSALVIA